MRRDERGHDLNAVDSERQRVTVQAGLAVILGELACVAVADRTGDRSQTGDRRGGRPADLAVSRSDPWVYGAAGGGCRPDHCLGTGWP
jgi:hypothetical protein